MSGFNSKYEEQMHKVKKRKVPSEDDLDGLCRFLEEYENILSEQDKVMYLKKAALNTVLYFNSFPALRQLDHMLRLYVIVGKYSANLGAHGIFDQCESKKFFCESFQFHLLWAESHAKQGHAQRFREIMELAHKRVKSASSSLIDAEFKKIASKYLIGEDIFPSLNEADHQQNIKQKKARRVSQVALLQDEALKYKDYKLQASIGRGKLIIKTEFIDKIGYLPFSFEELVKAVYEDNLEVVEMDISCDPIIKDPETIIKFEKPENYHLTPVAEMSEPNCSTEEKRRRIFSPQQPTRESRFNNPAKDARLPDASPVSFRESEYHKAAAIFSDTVNLGPREPQDSTMPVAQKQVEEFEVFEDPDPSVAASTVFVAPRERRPLAQINSDSLPAPVEKKTPFDLDISNIETDNAVSPYNFDDEPTLAGQRFGLDNAAKPTYGIVTSTPAPNAIVTNTITDNDFFSTNIDHKSAAPEPPVETNEAYGFLKKRKSIRATDIPVEVLKGAQPKDTTLSSAMAKMTVDANDSENPLEKTGIARPVEEITGSINPWDSTIRQKIMAHLKTPLNQHEYQTVAPRISRNKDVILSGMKFFVIDLVGEGGFAKVFKCMDDETKKNVALKYEVPSCAWEVYICNQVGARLSQLVTPSAKRTKKCVMEISDAFIFTNSSILINDYLRYGTLLDLSNKLHGGATSQMILYMAIHVATILRDVHACGIIHGDVKPDNIMILRPLDENWEIEEIFTTPVIKFIDWGRAIDMSALPKNTSFVGRAGTASFDCPEMMSGKPWNYHTDFFGFVASMNVFIHGKYAKLVQAGRNAMDQHIKRRLSCREVLTNIFDRLLNIPSCEDVPNWTEEIRLMTDFFRQEFNALDWKTAARLFNQNLPSDN